jgi:hypothetical protein
MLHDRNSNHPFIHPIPIIHVFSTGVQIMIGLV